MVEKNLLTVAASIFNSSAAPLCVEYKNIRKTKVSVVITLMTHSFWLWNFLIDWSISIICYLFG